MTKAVFGAAAGKGPLSRANFLGIIVVYELIKGGGPHVPDWIYPK